jgi:spermidine synthase
MSASIDISEEAGVRYLHFGSEWIQGAMRLRKPDALELTYTREMMAVLLWHEAFDGRGWPRRALLVGLGAGSLAKFIHRHLPQTRQTVVEIEPAVLRVAQEFFKLPEADERLHIVIADGAEYVATTRARFDLILVDGFDRHARAGELDGDAFYAACRARLTDEGLLATNLFGNRRGYKASFARLDEAFAGRAFALPPGEAGNVIAFACGEAPLACSLAEMNRRAAALRARTGLDLRPAIASLQRTSYLPGGLLCC